jgi:hypothetical protein
MNLLRRGRAYARLAVVLVAASLAVMVFAGTAIGHGTEPVKAGASPTVAANLTPSLMKHARWIRLRDGKRVWGVPLTVKVSAGKLMAHPASYGNCIWCTSHNNLGSGMCISSYPNTQGPNVSEYGCNGSANQEWVYAAYTLNEPYLFAYGSNSNLCLNNYGGGFSNGNRIGLWSCNASAPSMWFGAGGSDWNGWLLLHLFKAFGTWSNQCVTTLPGAASGGPIDQWTCNIGSSWQAWGGDWDEGSAPG